MRERGFFGLSIEVILFHRQTKSVLATFWIGFPRIGRAVALPFGKKREFELIAGLGRPEYHLTSSRAPIPSPVVGSGCSSHAVRRPNGLKHRSAKELDARKPGAFVKAQTIQNQFEF